VGCTEIVELLGAWFHKLNISFHYHQSLPLGDLYKRLGVELLNTINEFVVSLIFVSLDVA